MGSSVVRGRCVGVEDGVALIRDERALHRVPIASGEKPHAGDIVQITEGRVRVLTPNRSTDRSTRFTDRILDPRRLRAIGVRERVERALRSFLRDRGYRETRTPLLVPSPGMDPHVRPFRVTPHTGRGEDTAPCFLPTSPEFAMKRLLAGGLGRIFQIGPVFRSEPASRTHRAEFTMLELYRAHADDAALMEDVEALLAAAATADHGRSEVDFEGQRISLEPPWPRLAVRDLFAEHAGVDLVATSEAGALRAAVARLGLTTSDGDTWDDLFFRIWLDRVEPRLPRERAVFVCRYPASQAALAVVDEDPDGSRWARRFEIYAGGLELGNAFQELTDPIEQRRRFVADMEERRRAHGDEILPVALDEDFLAALEEGMPPTAGIAIGVDRLVMLVAGEPDIDFTFWLPCGA